MQTALTSQSPILIDIDQQAQLEEAATELTLSELCLVGGGTGSVIFG